MLPAKDQIDTSRLPQHIAIIMDGNGRWAKHQGKSRFYGHQCGVESVRRATEACTEVGVQYLTLFTFSTENWKRPKLEIDALLTLLVDTIHQETDNLIENKIRLETIGDLKALPQRCRQQLEEVQAVTSVNKGLRLNLALNYSARWDITQAVQHMMAQSVDPNQVNQDAIKANLTTAHLPDPEILIRTSGEFRISNFLLWELAYTELFFLQKHWPQFSKEDLWECILQYQTRERRFGMISEQLSESKR